MSFPDLIPGEMLPVRTPTWKPLLDLAPDHIDDFMWMYDVELEDGTRLHGYKHWWTRKYLHLDCEGRAFAYRDHGYQEVDPERVLELVLRRR